VSVFDLSSVLYFPACTNGNGTVQPNCADVTFRLHSLTHSATSACCEAEDIVHSISGQKCLPLFLQCGNTVTPTSVCFHVCLRFCIFTW